jgi:hypothetical protein
MRKAAWLLALFGLSVLIADVAMVRHFTVDDAYITLRYSRNLADGHGAVYNAAGARAEGYTSPAWMVLLALPHLVHIDALFVAKVLGVLSTCATCALVGVWVFSETEDTSSRAVAAAAAMTGYAVLPRTAIHAVSGMETAFYTLLLTVTLFAAARVARDGPRWALSFSLAGLAAALTRPEAAIAVVVAGAAAAWLRPATERKVVLRTVALVVLAPLALYQAWRIRYYGVLAPLPFYVKVASPGLLPGAQDVADWLRALLPFGVPAAVALVGSSRQHRVLIAAVTALVLFFLLPQHLMGYDNRYLAPLDPTVCVLFGLGLGRLVSPKNEPDRRRRLRLAFVSALALFPVAMSAKQAPAALRERIEYGDGLSAAHIELGRDLASRLPSGARLAISDAGAVPYFSGLWTLDLVGLNDPHIAVTGRRDPSTILAQSPDVVVLVSSEPNRFAPFAWNAFERPIHDALVDAGFEKVDLRRFAPDYWLWVMAKAGSLHPRIADARASFRDLAVTERPGTGVRRADDGAVTK